eukprot:gene21877-57317_t
MVIPNPQHVRSSLSARRSHRRVVAGAMESKGRGLKRAYLIWDDGFARDFSLSLAALVLVVWGSAHVPAVPTQQVARDAQRRVVAVLVDGTHRGAWWAAVGLLSSSCCAVQLALNALNFGCAGFNSVLGPLRPVLCAVGACAHAAMWHAARRRVWDWAPWTAAAVALTLLPERAPAFNGLQSFIPDTVSAAR